MAKDEDFIKCMAIKNVNDTNLSYIREKQYCKCVDEYVDKLEQEIHGVKQSKDPFFNFR